MAAAQRARRVASARHTPDPVLAATAITKRFDDTAVALHDVSFSIEPAEVVAVVGPSGSGKSTLLHCLSGILPVDTGEVRFDNVVLSGLGEAERARVRRRSFGFVFQFGQLVPELRLLDNVALPLVLDGVKRSDARVRAERLMAQLEVLELARRYPGEVSGGEAQRAAVARALVAEPSVIFADEPTGALDSRSGDVVMRLLVEAAQEVNAAVVLVTHAADVASHATRTATMRDGVILATG